MKKNFVKTKDQKTAELLKQNGYTFVSQEGDVYTFINDGHASFDVKERVVFTNILNV